MAQDQPLPEAGSTGDGHAPEPESEPEATAPEPPRWWAARLVDLSGSVYGTILSSSIILALSYRHHGNAWVMLGALAVTEAVFTLAHAWSELLAAGRAQGGLPRLADLVHTLAHEWPVLQASWPAFAALLLSALGVFSATTGVYAALVANAVILFLWGAVLAQGQRISIGRAMVAGAVTCALGLVLVALKVIVH